MKPKIFALSVILILGCSEKSALKPGTYKYVRPSKLQFGYLYLTQGINSYFVGSELDLKNDSSFRYTTCGNIITGKWFTVNDSLFLTVYTNRWRSDSLNEYGFNGTWPQISKKPIGFKIKNGHLESIFEKENGDKIITILKFNEP